VSTFIPSDTRGVAYTDKSNLALLLARYVSFGCSGKAPNIDQKQVLGQLKDLLGRADTTLMAEASAAVVQRLDTSLQSECYSGRVLGTTVWRAVSGMGEHSVLENAITLHSLYGFPYFRGSAVKGMTHAWAEHWLQGECRNSIDTAFGKMGKEPKDFHVGGVRFSGGWPLELSGNPLEIDIVNPHYGDYYEKGSAPADWCSPVPSYFLAIKSGIRFAFYLSGDEEEPVRQATVWMKDALQTIGIGAKTAAGYGYFECGQAKLRKGAGEWTPVQE